MPEPEQKSLSSVVKELAESSSMHGIPKIVSSRQLSVKILWCILVTGTFCVMAYQLNTLFGNFNSNPVVTNVNLEFSSLQFPAITFCNMNPVRKSKLDLVPSLKGIIYKKKSDKKGSTIPHNDDEDSTIPEGHLANSERKKRGTGDTGPSSTETAPLEEHDDTEESEYYDPWDYYDSEDGMYEPDNYSAYSGYLEESGLDEEARELITSPRDVWKKQRDEIKTAIKKLPLWQISEIGHQREDLIYSFSFAGRRQNTSQIFEFNSAHYGNCYEISSSKFKAWRSGPDHGIKLTFNLETSEYIENFASGFGMRFVFHQPGSVAMPSQEGLTISSGFDTSIGIRTVRISRLGEPYGRCSDGAHFWKTYGFNYSVSACMEYCRVRRVMEICECLPYDSPPLYTSDWTGLGVCEVFPSNDSLCALEVAYHMEKDHGLCDCPSACNEVVYEKTLSGRAWPSEEYLSRVLLREVCRRNISSMKQACAEKENGTLKPEKYINNFLTVRIYFEDLNYESIVQEPMYEPVRFVSDIGGTLGLFLGISVLTIVEVVQLLLEVCLHVFRRLKPKKTRQSLKDNPPVRFVSDIGGTLGLFLGISFLTMVEVFQLMLEVCLHVFRRLKPKATSQGSKDNPVEDGAELGAI